MYFIHIRNETLERNDGNITTWLAPEDYTSPFRSLTWERTTYMVTFWPYIHKRTHGDPFDPYWAHGCHISTT